MQRNLTLFLLLFIAILRAEAQPGSIDTTFVTEFDFTTGQQISTIHILPNGDVLAGGNFIIPLIDGFKIGNLIKYDSSGNFNPKWNQGKGFDKFVRNIFPVEQDKLLIIGDFVKYHDTDCGKLAKLKKDYSIDLTYTVPKFTAVTKAALQSDGKILLQAFTQGFAPVLMRLKADGSIDSGFKELKFGNFTVLLVQSDEKIIVAGGSVPNGIIRLTKSGISDPTFVYKVTTDLVSIYSAALQSDGKIILAGADGATFKSRVVRLNTDGSLDNTFIPLLAVDQSSIANSIFIQKDDKIILGGRFVIEGKKKHNNIIRLQANGVIDTTFETGTGFSSFVNVIVPYKDNKIMVGGNFTSYNGDLASRIIRLNLDAPTSLPFPKTGRQAIFPNPVQTQLFVEFAEPVTTATVTDALGREVLQFIPNAEQFSINLEHHAAGVYFVRLQSQNQNIVRKVVKN